MFVTTVQIVDRLARLDNEYWIDLWATAFEKCAWPEPYSGTVQGEDLGEQVARIWSESSSACL
ncbi:hypothetical protein M0657_007576 [Pyricularia oryzae]|nr:hypothetical protein M0657_007576 [Pyricularia oryzae]